MRCLAVLIEIYPLVPFRLSVCEEEPVYTSRVRGLAPVTSARAIDISIAVSKKESSVPRRCTFWTTRTCWTVVGKPKYAGTVACLWSKLLEHGLRLEALPRTRIARIGMPGWRLGVPVGAQVCGMGGDGSQGWVLGSLSIGIYIGDWSHL